jgi:hypothetical protein
MKALLRTVAMAGVLSVGGLGLAASPARAQAFGFGYASPGLSFGVATGGFGYYGGYPLVAPAPVVVAPAPVVVARPLVVPRPYYRGYYPAYRPYGGYYRGYPRYYRR